MDLLENAFKCKLCGKIFKETPMLLSCCNETICRHHITTATLTNQIYICSLCEKKHDLSDKMFPLNKFVGDLLEMKLNTLKFGKVYDESLKACLNLDNELKKMKALLNEPSAYINEKTSILRNKIEQRRNELKREVDIVSDEFIKRLEAYEDECMENLRFNMEKSLAELNKDHEDSVAKLSAWTYQLNELIIDEEKWKAIQLRAKLCQNQTVNAVYDVKTQLVLNKSWKLKRDPTFSLSDEFIKELKLDQRR